jgi:hypothetical protein
MSDGTEGRQILPIPDTPYEGDVPLDAREASFPPMSLSGRRREPRTS